MISQAAPPQDPFLRQKQQAESDAYAARAETTRRALGATPAPVPTETRADREGRARMERERAAAIAKPAPPVPASEYWHTDMERRGDRIIVKRSTHEVLTPPPRPVADEKPALSYDERLRRARL